MENEAAVTEHPSNSSHVQTLADFYLSEIRPQVQVTLNCNLGCTYCFQEHVGPIMRLETAKAIIDQIVETFYTSSRLARDNSLDIIWHGGEPLTAGYRFFKSILEIQAHHPEIHFKNHVQTNATLMDESLAALFAENNFYMGFSLDGPEDLHDLHRRTRKLNRGTFKDTMRGVEMYQKRARLERIPVMMVVTTASIDRCGDIYSFFKDLGADVGIDIFDIVASDLGGTDGSRDWRKQLAPSSAQIGKFLIELFDHWFYDYSRRVSFRELRDEVKIVYEEDLPRGDPFHKKRCHTTRTIFAPDGNVYSCDQYINDAKSSLGNVHTEKLKNIILRKALLWESIKKNIRGKRSASKFACPSCEWAAQCAGGCVTCMKYNSLLLTTRERGLDDSRWEELLDEPTPLDSIYGEFYYCSGLIDFRAHVRAAIKKELEQ
jgi:uncharacterized protein